MNRVLVIKFYPNKYNKDWCFVCARRSSWKRAVMSPPLCTKTRGQTMITYGTKAKLTANYVHHYAPHYVALCATARIM